MLRKVVSIVLLLCCALLALSIDIEVDAKRVKVKGYYRKDGTYVKSHTRRAPSRSRARSSYSRNRVNPNKTWVRGYYRKDGTWVKGHYRTMPNDTVKDNYSYPGNRNPHTGKIAPGIPRNYPDSYYKTHHSKSKGEFSNTWTKVFPNEKWPKTPRELKLAKIEMNKEISNFNRIYINYSYSDTKIWKQSGTFKQMKKWSNKFIVRTNDKFLTELDSFVLQNRNFIIKSRFYERYIKVPCSLQIIKKAKDFPKSFVELERKGLSKSKSSIDTTKAVLEPLPLPVINK